MSHVVPSWPCCVRSAVLTIQSTVRMLRVWRAFLRLRAASIVIQACAQGSAVGLCTCTPDMPQCIMHCLFFSQCSGDSLWKDLAASAAAADHSFTYASVQDSSLVPRCGHEMHLCSSTNLKKEKKNPTDVPDMRVPLQARSRGWLARRRCMELRRAHAAALRVQTSVRGHQQRRRFRQQLAAVGMLQAGVRRWQARRPVY